MNSVDSLRGMGSINNMAQQYGFTLLRPAFMTAMSPEMVDKMDLNKTVKNILKPRIGEFFKWVELSEKELRKRYNIQVAYLKNQVETLKLYSKWVRPYIKAAQQLGMKENTEPALVSVFGSMILELTLLAKREMNLLEEVEAKSLPSGFGRKKNRIRKFYQIILVDFKFRTYPTQQAPHAGRVEINFKAYALNEDELLLFEKLREEEDLESIFGIAERVTGESLKELQKEIDSFLKPKDEKKDAVTHYKIF